MVELFKEYYELARATQQYKFEKTITEDEYNSRVDDALVRNVPIYDVVNRKYAAFSSFPEAIVKKHKDPKGNGRYFKANTVPHNQHLASLLYLFRLCGSGINYIPNVEGEPWGTHGFGNFWVVDCIRSGRYRRHSWLDQLPESKFCDVKGYMLPMISGGMYNFIKSGKAFELVDHIWDKLDWRTKEIYEIVEIGNKWLIENGYKRQNFVLCAFAMDLAEYFPSLVDPTSRVLVGSNAKRCLKLIFPEVKGMGTNLDVTNEALRHLCDITGDHSLAYDMEDVACDFIRYINNFQSPAHIEANNGIEYKNKFS